MGVTQTGSTLTFPGLGSGNTGTVSSTITVPADAEIVVVGWSGYSVTANFFSTGGMTFTKGGVDTAMTLVSGGDASNGWSGVMAYLILPDTGSNKTLKWDWAGAGTASDAASLCSVTFWTGTNTASQVRGSSAGQNTTNTPYTTGTITAAAGDLIVAWVGAFVGVTEGTVDSWSNLTLLTQITRSGNADGAWATGAPSGNTTVAASTDTNLDDGAIWAISIKAAAAAAVAVLDKPRRRFLRR